jgi:2-dehydro-3-deoxygluconokinase
MTYDLFTFGEAMLKLMPPHERRLEQTAELLISAGGSELNVACGLARLGKRPAWFSRLPSTPLSSIVINTLRQHGVDVSQVLRVPDERLGLFFVEYGVPPRGIRVLYDRAHSAASKLTAEDLPYNAIAQSGWLHMSGITPALSPACAEAVTAAMRFAHAHNIHVSFDVNYRALLWSAKDAAKALNPLCEGADVVFIALRDAVSLFGAAYDMEQALTTLHERWRGAVIITQSDAGCGGINAHERAQVNAYPVTIRERVGAGDAFVAGALCQLLERAPLTEVLQFGAATAALKLSMSGEIALVTRDEVQALINGQGGGLVR